MADAGAIAKPGEPVRDRLLEVLKALADPTRLEMVALFSQQDDFACTGLEREFSISKSTISYHVKVLTTAGLVETSKRGRFYHYRLRRDVLEAVLPGLLEGLVGTR